MNDATPSRSPDGLPDVRPAHSAGSGVRSRSLSLSQKAAPAMTPTDRQAAIVGKRVLAGFEKGRQMAIAQAQHRSAKLAVQIFYLMKADQQAGQPSRGQAARIRSKLGSVVSERHIKRILDGLDRLSSMSDSKAYGEETFTGVSYGKLHRS